ncbi:MAG TPA: response regulator [Bacteroidia bacterium]|nr:response regulator [Bacteroidia bacterium]
MHPDSKKPAFQKVLVIDDNPTDRYIANRILQKYHFAEEIVLLESGTKALEYLKTLSDVPEELPQFIFLDIRMPEMDGFDFLDHFANLPQCIQEHCVILMLSTSSHPDDLNRIESSPYVYQFLNKPFDKSNMEELEKRFVSKRM